MSGALKRLIEGMSRELYVILRGIFIAFVQKVKIFGFNMVCCLRFACNDAYFFYSNHDKGKGGVVILIGNNLSSHIKDFG